MASELRLTTLANNAGTESVDTTYVINGSVKAWGYLNGDNTTFYDSFGMSSASDEGTGDTNFTLSSAMSSTNFAVTGAAGQTTDNEYATNFCANNNTRTTTVFQVKTGYAVASADGAADRDVVCFNITGDLA
tara:strand:- start:397 stop:792 length:396 start_codon:yes stop_codon:yes gene_type:complete